MVDKAGEKGYTASQIMVLEGLEPVRKRPGMYIGSTGSTGLHHLVWEVVDNAVDEALAGFCTQVWVILKKDGSVEVIDNGRGIPVDIHPQTKLSALETVMTKLHAGGKFGTGGYKVSGGLHGVGVSVVNALSSFTLAEVARDGKLYAQEYKRGKTATKLQTIKTPANGSYPFPLPGAKSGTKITFMPDSEILEVLNFDFKTILEHLRQQAYLTKGITIKIFDERESLSDGQKLNIGHKENEVGKEDIVRTYAFCFEGGISSFVKHINKAKGPLFKDPVAIEKESGDVAVEASLQYTEGFAENTFTFANNINTPEGGTHLTGFKTALTRVINDYAKKQGYMKNGDGAFTGDDVREGLTAVISVKVKNPQFEGQTKQKLGNPEVRVVTESVIQEGLSIYLEEHPTEARKILEKCSLASRARQAARAARETVIRKGLLEGMTLPGKLADCSSKKPEESEIYIVEGDSAGGSAKQGRDRSFQAILPLRGKILNVEKARLDKILTSQEIKALIVALGAGIGEQFDISRLRYHRIIIMTDADVDGSHIRTLLLTLFFRHMPEIIQNGYLYIAQPPLYKIQAGKEKQYAYNDAEKEAILKGVKRKTKNEKDVKPEEVTKEVGEEVGAEGESEEVENLPAGEAGKPKSGVSIQRYKGLGEMNPDQLWETTMNPESRLILQVKADDAQKADQMFETLMGDQVAPRKRFIQTHAKTVKNLDV